MAFGAMSSDTALAGSLLSGYGGPGQGNQAILGSALLNRPGGGSGANGPGSSGSSTSTSAGSSASATAGGASSGSGSVGRSATGGNPRSSRTRSAAARGAQAGRSGTSPRSIADVYAAAERGAPAASAVALGLSGADFLLILLTLGMLGLIGALSWRLARSRSTGAPRPESGG